jgi:hypothetical protein
MKRNFYLITRDLIDNLRDPKSHELMGEGWFLSGTLLLSPLFLIETAAIPLYFLIMLLRNCCHISTKKFWARRMR